MWRIILICISFLLIGCQKTQKIEIKTKERDVYNLYDAVILKGIASHYTKTDLPRKIDDITTLTKIYGARKKLFYIAKIDTKNQDKKLSQNEINLIRKPLVNSMCTDEKIRKLLNNSVHIYYVYVDMTGKHLFNIPVYPSDCKLKDNKFDIIKSNGFIYKIPSEFVVENKSMRKERYFFLNKILKVSSCKEDSLEWFNIESYIKNLELQKNNPKEWISFLKYAHNVGKAGCIMPED
jgi:hypothetical protein